MFDEATTATGIRDVAFPSYNTVKLQLVGDLSARSDAAEETFLQPRLVVYDIDGDGASEVAVFCGSNLECLFKSDKKIQTNFQISTLGGSDSDVNKESKENYRDRDLPLTSPLFIRADEKTYMIKVYACGMIDIIKYEMTVNRKSPESATIRAAEEKGSQSEFVYLSINRLHELPFNMSHALMYKTEGSKVILVASALNVFYFLEIELTGGSARILTELSPASRDIYSFDISGGSCGKYLVYSDIEGVVGAYSIEGSGRNFPPPSILSNSNSNSSPNPNPIANENESSSASATSLSFTPASSAVLSTIQHPSIVCFISFAARSVDVNPYDAVFIAASSEGGVLVIGILPDNSHELVNRFEIDDSVMSINMMSSSDDDTLVIFACHSGVTLIFPYMQLINHPKKLSRNVAYSYDMRLVHDLGSCVQFCCGDKEFCYATSLGHITFVNDIQEHLKRLAV